MSSDAFKRVVVETGEVVYKQQGVSRSGRMSKASLKMKKK